MSQAANAASRKPIDPRITTTSWVVGGASSAAYWASGGPAVPVYGLTTFGCAAVSPMVATVALNRPLKYREAHILIGSCVIPFIGGWLVNEWYNTGVLWAPDEAPKKKMRRARR
jgi:hypothetical protein